MPEKSLVHNLLVQDMRFPGSAKVQGYGSCNSRLMQFFGYERISSNLDTWDNVVITSDQQTHREVNL